jgi:rare lipoprotein A
MHLELKRGKFLKFFHKSNLIPLLFCLVSVIFLSGCASDTSDMCNGNCTPVHPKFANRAYNKTYTVRGETHTPQTFYEHSSVGEASYYGGRDVFHGRPTSNGEKFHKNAMTAAHKTIPIPAVIVVTNLDNGRSVRLKVNDRGPFVYGRTVDVSEKAAKILGIHRKGTGFVRVETDVNASLLLAQEMASFGRKGKYSQSFAHGADSHLTHHNKSYNKNNARLQSSSSAFYIDAGGFYNRNKAEAFAKYFSSSGIPHRLKKSYIGSRALYNVYFGPFSSVQKAENSLKKLRGPVLRGARVVNI